MLGHAHITTTLRYIHHRPGAEDARRIGELFAGAPVDALTIENVSRKKSPTRDIEVNSDQLNEEKHP